jgi:CTP:molybdopterin cytidylyltransferase MocA
MPLLPARIFRSLGDEAVRRKEAGEIPAAIFAAFHGILGHPVWIPLEFLEPIRHLPAGSHLRDFLLTQAWTTVEADTDAVLIDIDEPGQYHEALETRGSSLAGQPVP